MKFTKMHGLGNDFVVVDGFSESVPNAEEFDLAMAELGGAGHGEGGAA